MKRTGIPESLQRIVIKLGTNVLTDAQMRPDLVWMRELAAQVAELKKRGIEVVIVSSGAVGAGMGALGYERRPKQLAEQQACAAVGQSRLMTVYEHIFGEFGLITAQALFTHEDLRHKSRHINARNTLVRLLEHGVVPIVNENDAVSFTELKFGDNDKLSALVACLIPADLLVLLTTVDGLLENFGKPEAKMISTVERIDARLKAMAQGAMTQTSVGGMISKLQAGQIATRAGIPMVIAHGRQESPLLRIVNGDSIGTLFAGSSQKLKGRKRWIAFFHHPKGSVTVDEGARMALVDSGKSLLAPGILSHEGSFKSGDVIEIRDHSGVEFARGIVAYDSGALTNLSAIETAVIHRDNMTIL